MLVYNTAKGRTASTLIGASKVKTAFLVNAITPTSLYTVSAAFHHRRTAMKPSNLFTASVQLHL